MSKLLTIVTQTFCHELPHPKNLGGVSQILLIFSGPLKLSGTPTPLF